MSSTSGAPGAPKSLVYVLAAACVPGISSTQTIRFNFFQDNFSPFLLWRISELELHC
eukprot:COSAG02_NODE_31372_length_534_cov_3.305747_1_plen_56_part_10